MAGQRQFFSQLPAGKLNPAEVELREVLHRAATIAGGFLPRHITLQDWLEKRMPGELLLTVDAARRVSLLPLPAPATAAPDFSRDVELFFKRLPGDSFLPEEDRLRDALMERLRVGPTPVGQGVDPRIVAVTRDFLPSYVLFADWIERRIGAEVSVFTNEHGQKLAKLGLEPPVGPKVPGRADDFFGGLPADSYLPEEERLRNSIFDFLASWQSQELATLTHIGGDKGVKAAKSAFMPAGVAIREWVERRMGAELELRKDSKGQLVVHLTAAAHPCVRDRYEAKKAEEKGGGPEHVASEEARQKFFSSLPSTELTAQELTLREKLLDFLNAWDTRRPTGPPPMISDVGQDSAIQVAKAAFLPRGMPFKEWIDRRVGMEIETKRHANGQDAIFLRGAKSARQADRSEKSASSPAVREEAKKEQDLKKEAFLKTLPVDDFSTEELELRQALLAFLEQWPADQPSPDLGKASQDPIVQSCRLALLPRGCGCGMQGWIDRRIGGEIETKTVAGVAFFGLRGHLTIENMDSKKRKASLDKPPVRAGSGGAARPRR